MDSQPESLGQLRQTFKPRLGNIAAGVIIGLALIAGGISAVVGIARQPDRKPLDSGDRIAKVCIYVLLGGILPLGGIALLVWMKRLATHRVALYDQGFSYSEAGTADICRWSDVAKISEVFTAEQLKVLKVPGASIKNIDRSFVVLRKDGKNFDFNVNSIDGIPRLAECLQEASTRYQIPWERIDQ